MLHHCKTTGRILQNVMSCSGSVLKQTNKNYTRKCKLIYHMIHRKECRHEEEKPEQVHNLGIKTDSLFYFEESFLSYLNRKNMD